MLSFTRRSVVLLVACVAGTTWSAAAVSSPQNERIAVAFLLAHGRTPLPDEIEHATDASELSVAERVKQERESLRHDAVRRAEVAARAGRDALGIEDKAHAADEAGRVYFEQVRDHLAWLRERPAEYEQVIRRAYRLVVNRDAYEREIAYWKSRDVLSYALLVGCIEDWARRNQPGLMATTGRPAISVNSRFLTTLPLSPGVANEAREAIESISEGEAFTAAFGRNLVAPGGSEVATVGRMHFAAAGSERLR